jgi:hypothetical protein
MRLITLLLLLMVVGDSDQSSSAEPRGFVPRSGFVPDAATALKIAEAVLIPVYGEAVVHSERPFKAVLKGDAWIVTGSVPCDGPPGAVCLGGESDVRISKKTAQILFMTHYK